MSEFIKRFTVDPLASEGDDLIEFGVWGAFQKITLHIVPIDSGGGSPDDSSAELEWEVDGSYYPENPPGSATTLANNKDNVITSENVHQKGRLKVTNGTTPPDGGLKVELWGLRR